MGRHSDYENPNVKLDSRPFEKDPSIRVYGMEMKQMDDITRIKTLLASVINALAADSHDIMLIHRLTGNKSISYIYLTRQDLILTFVNHIHTAEDSVDTDYRTLLTLRRISEYGETMYTKFYSEDELQDTIIHTINAIHEYYFKNMSRVDRIIDNFFIRSNRTKDNILNALIDDFTGVTSAVSDDTIEEMIADAVMSVKMTKTNKNIMKKAMMKCKNPKV